MGNRKHAGSDVASEPIGISETEKQGDLLAAYQRQRDLFRQWLEVEERRRVAAAGLLHDEVIQPLVAALMTLEACLPSSGKPDRSLLKDSLDLLRGSLAIARRLMNRLRPPILDELGLAAAVEHVVEERRRAGGPKVDFSHAIDGRPLPPALESALFRIVEEGLDNAIRHSGCRTVRIGLARHPQSLHLSIEDDGNGFDQRRVPPDRFGLKSIRAQARLMGGYARIHSAPGQGTRIFAEVSAVMDGG